jgi:hypothetical protein
MVGIPSESPTNKTSLPQRCGDHADHAAMNETVLLPDAAPMRQVDVNPAMFDHRQFRLAQGHGVLADEAGAYALGESRAGSI